MKRFMSYSVVHPTVGYVLLCHSTVGDVLLCSLTCNILTANKCDDASLPAQQQTDTMSYGWSYRAPVKLKQT